MSCKYCRKTLYTKDFTYFTINSKAYKYNKIPAPSCHVCGRNLKEGK